MSATCSWMEKCPVCNGNKKIQTLDKKTKVVSPCEECPGCEGAGYIMIKKSMFTKK